MGCSAQCNGRFYPLNTSWVTCFSCGPSVLQWMPRRPRDLLQRVPSVTSWLWTLLRLLLLPAARFRSLGWPHRATLWAQAPVRAHT